MPILGVVRDYQLLNVARPIEPTVFHTDPSGFNYATIRVHPETSEAFATYLRTIWKRLDPFHPLEFEYYDDQIRDNGFNQTFSDRRAIRLGSE